MWPEILTLISLAGATLVSEDLACVTAGVLIERGEIGAVAAVLACAVGIGAGDIALWALGRVFGAAALRWRWVALHLRGERFADLSAWLERHAAAAIVGSRFLPGTRLPTYVLSGFMRVPAATFLLWMIVGVTVWTPVPVFFSAALGGLFAALAPWSQDQRWALNVGMILSVTLLLYVLRAATART